MEQETTLLYYMETKELFTLSEKVQGMLSLYIELKADALLTRIFAREDQEVKKMLNEAERLIFLNIEREYTQYYDRFLK